MIEQIIIAMAAAAWKLISKENSTSSIEPQRSSPDNSSSKDDDGLRYDIAISFAGPDRAIAGDIATKVKAAGFRVFYDEYEVASLWGADLYIHLSDVYQNRARFCLMLVSTHYAERLWTKHELRAAQARAFREKKIYILPLRLDDTEIPGILNTTGYIDLEKHTTDQVVSMLIEKLRKEA